MAVDNGFTPTERRMLKLLSDWQPHTEQELHGCLNDELGDIENFRPHLTTLRKKLEKRGQGVLCQRESLKKSYYRLCRLTANPNDE